MRPWGRRSSAYAHARQDHSRLCTRGWGVMLAVAGIGTVVVVAEYLASVVLRDHLVAQRGTEKDLDPMHLRRASSSDTAGASSTEIAPGRHPQHGESGVLIPVRVGGVNAASLVEPAAGGEVDLSSATVQGVDVHSKFETLTRLRDGECRASDCRVLITGCGRSGTHFLAEQFERAGVPLKHETIGEAGTVSWIHAAPYKEELRELEKWFSDEKSVELRSSTDFQSFPVFHLVRHPLAALTSLTECFCGCGSMSCGAWADPPSWKWAGKSVRFSDRHCSRKINNEVCAAHKHSTGRLIRSMEYWLQWNQLAGSQAHYRLQLETVKLSEVVEAAPKLKTKRLPNGAIAPVTIEQKPFSSNRARRRRTKPVSWESMRSADAVLEAQVWDLAQSYGYTRDAP